MKLTILILCFIMLSGCDMPVRRVIDPLPNTGAGFWQDVSGAANAMIEHHERTILVNSVKDAGRAVNNVEEQLTRFERIKKRLSRLEFRGK